MPLRVSDTLSDGPVPFEPRDDEVLMYVCGLTVSDPAHLGHARLWVHADVFHRWLVHRGYAVRHVENFTDVNEKIVARIGDDDLGETEPAVARTLLGETIRDMRSLGLLRAEVYPRVSEHIPEIVALVERLVDAGYAYESGGSVYFDVTAFDDYGALSGQRVADLEEQGDPAERAEKRHPADFALWKAGAVEPDTAAEHRDPSLPPLAEPAGQTWDSPWGRGRPGWHVECSAMAMTHLEETIDIHVGGQDLVFPHHENEIAQSEAATGREFARYWLHVRLLDADAEKMSSSLGNFLTVREAVSTYGANVVRMFLLSAAYSQRQTYSESALSEAEQRWDRLARGYDRAVSACDSVDARTTAIDEGLRTTAVETDDAVTAAMDDDFNTRAAIAALLELTAAINRHVDERSSYDYVGLRQSIETLRTFGGEVLGFDFAGERDGETRLAREVVELVLGIREAAREAGEYDRADELRASLEALGIEVQDTDEGPTYRL